ncbi:hypothetical protein JZ751_013045 [Albula glossodonta]|uniref:Uncharacterized protein n=1 Tax=Albula glossodonta TaxID=121402 RepID=A0A8T2P4T2_9TELE|nr:hypothetical protein JZ751_013045 [Albula glossodonta]
MLFSQERERERQRESERETVDTEKASVLRQYRCSEGVTVLTPDSVSQVTLCQYCVGHCESLSVTALFQGLRESQPKQDNCPTSKRALHGERSDALH